MVHQINIFYTRRKKGRPPSHENKNVDFETRVMIGWLVRIFASQPIRTHATNSKFFPGQLAFCKKAVVGLAARRTL